MRHRGKRAETDSRRNEIGQRAARGLGVRWDGWFGPGFGAGQYGMTSGEGNGDMADLVRVKVIAVAMSRCGPGGAGKLRRWA